MSRRRSSATKGAREDLKTELSRAQARITDLLEACDKSAETMEMLQTTIETLNGQVAELGDRVRELTKERDELRKVIETPKKTKKA